MGLGGRLLCLLLAKSGRCLVLPSVYDRWLAANKPNFLSMYVPPPCYGIDEAVHLLDHQSSEHFGRLRRRACTLRPSAHVHFLEICRFLFTRVFFKRNPTESYFSSIAEVDKEIHAPLQQK